MMTELNPPIIDRTLWMLGKTIPITHVAAQKIVVVMKLLYRDIKH